MLNLEQAGKTLKISYFNKKGKISLAKIPLRDSDMFNYSYEKGTPDTSVESFNGKPVKKMRTARLDEFRKLQIMHRLPQYVKDEIYASHMPQKWFMDIETEVLTDKIPDANNPREKILTNAFCNDTDYKATLTGVKPINARELEDIQKRVNEHLAPLGITYEIEYKQYDSESQMLMDLYYTHIPKMPFISGWNFLKFDWNYMVARCKHLGIDYTRSSPTGTMFELFIKDKFSDEKSVTVELPMHRAVTDYMTIYEKYDSYVEVKESSSLDYVSQEVFGLGKVSYPGSLMELYDRDFPLYLFYNVIDTILVCELDKKIQSFNTMLKLSCEGRVPLHEAQFASDIVQNLFSENFLKRGKVFVKEYGKKFGEKEKYKGGYVKEPEAGFHEWLMGLDYESLFPTIMMAFNQGVDTFLGKTFDKGKTYVDMDGNEQTIDPDKHIWSASGAVFDKTYDSVTRETIIDLFKFRIHNKLTANEIEEDIAYLKSIVKSRNNG